jgi:hypothetical protein
VHQSFALITGVDAVQENSILSPLSPESLDPGRVVRHICGMPTVRGLHETGQFGERLVKKI